MINVKLGLLTQDCRQKMSNSVKESVKLSAFSSFRLLSRIQCNSDPIQPIDFTRRSWLLTSQNKNKK